MVDRFDLSREQPQKQWWRERPIAPATFFGFPDVTKHNLRGGSLYVEQMDSVTLAVLADKCLKEGIWDPEIWTKFSWRAQQIAARTHEPDLCYIFRAFARADWFDQNLLTTYLGRLHRRLHMFHLPDVAVVLEAFANSKFRQGDYLQKSLLHLALLLQHRDDAKAVELARCCAALRALRPLSRELAKEVVEAMELLAEALLNRDLSELPPSRTILVIDAYVSWGLVSPERVAPTNAALDLCWTCARELKGRLRAHGKEKPEDLATLALALASGGLRHEELWAELVHNLEFEAGRLPGPAVASAILGLSRAGRCTAALYEALMHRLGLERSSLSPLDCARAAAGFLRGPRDVAEKAVTRGPVYQRITELGLPAFTGEELVTLLDALARAPHGTWGAEMMAGAVLEAVCPKLKEMAPAQLASVARSLAHLRPSSSELLAEVLDRAQEAFAEAAAEDEGGGAAGGGPAPRHFAMLCQGIAGQPAATLPDAPARLEALLPRLSAALAAKPTALTAAQIVGSLARCPATALRAEVLDACSERLAARACDLSASSLVSLAGALAAAAGVAPGRDAAQPGWSPPQPLLEKLVLHLDIKRYDLAPGTLWRAARALEGLGVAPGHNIRLEPRDQPRERAR